MTRNFLSQNCNIFSVSSVFELEGKTNNKCITSRQFLSSDVVPTYTIWSLVTVRNQLPLLLPVVSRTFEDPDRVISSSFGGSLTRRDRIETAVRQFATVRPAGEDVCEPHNGCRIYK